MKNFRKKCFFALVSLCVCGSVSSISSRTLAMGFTNNGPRLIDYKWLNKHVDNKQKGMGNNTNKTGNDDKDDDNNNEDDDKKRKGKRKVESSKKYEEDKEEGKGKGKRKSTAKGKKTTVKTTVEEKKDDDDDDDKDIDKDTDGDKDTGADTDADKELEEEEEEEGKTKKKAGKNNKNKKDDLDDDDDDDEDKLDFGGAKDNNKDRPGLLNKKRKSMLDLIKTSNSTGKSTTGKVGTNAQNEAVGVPLTGTNAQGAGSVLFSGTNAQGAGASVPEGEEDVYVDRDFDLNRTLLDDYKKVTKPDGTSGEATAPYDMIKDFKQIHRAYRAITQLQQSIFDQGSPDRFQYFSTLEQLQAALQPLQFVSPVIAREKNQVLNSLKGSGSVKVKQNKAIKALRGLLTMFKDNFMDIFQISTYDFKNWVDAGCGLTYFVDFQTQGENARKALVNNLPATAVKLIDALFKSNPPKINEFMTYIGVPPVDNREAGDIRTKLRNLAQTYVTSQELATLFDDNNNYSSLGKTLYANFVAYKKQLEDAYSKGDQYAGLGIVPVGQRGNMLNNGVFDLQKMQKHKLRFLAKVISSVFAKGFSEMFCQGLIQDKLADTWESLYNNIAKIVNEGGATYVTDTASSTKARTVLTYMRVMFTEKGKNNSFDESTIQTEGVVLKALSDLNSSLKLNDFKNFVSGLFTDESVVKQARLVALSSLYKDLYDAVYTVQAYIDKDNFRSRIDDDKQPLFWVVRYILGNSSLLKSNVTDVNSNNKSTDIGAGDYDKLQKGKIFNYLFNGTKNYLDRVNKALQQYSYNNSSELTAAVFDKERTSLLSVYAYVRSAFKVLKLLSKPLNELVDADFEGLGLSGPVKQYLKNLKSASELKDKLCLGDVIGLHLFFVLNALRLTESVLATGDLKLSNYDLNKDNKGTFSNVAGATLLPGTGNPGQAGNVVTTLDDASGIDLFLSQVLGYQTKQATISLGMGVVGLFATNAIYKQSLGRRLIELSDRWESYFRTGQDGLKAVGANGAIPGNIDPTTGGPFSQDDFLKHDNTDGARFKFIDYIGINYAATLGDSTTAATVYKPETTGAIGSKWNLSGTVKFNFGSEYDDAKLLNGVLMELSKFIDDDNRNIKNELSNGIGLANVDSAMEYIKKDGSKGTVSNYSPLAISILLNSDDVKKYSTSEYEVSGSTTTTTTNPGVPYIGSGPVGYGTYGFVNPSGGFVGPRGGAPRPVYGYGYGFPAMRTHYRMY